LGTIAVWRSGPRSESEIFFEGGGAVLGCLVGFFELFVGICTRIHTRTRTHAHTRTSGARSHVYTHGRTRAHAHTHTRDSEP
jgi:hypothetical protein